MKAVGRSGSSRATSTKPGSRHAVLQCVQLDLSATIFHFVASDS